MSVYTVFFSYTVNTVKGETMIFSNAQNMLTFLLDVLIRAYEICSFDKGIESVHFIFPWYCSVKEYNAINLYRFTVYVTLQGVFNQSLTFNEQNIKERR